MVAHLVLNFISIAIGFYLSTWIGVINTFSAFMLWLYSNQLKRMPLIGNITIAALTSVTLLIFAIYYDLYSYLIYAYAIFSFFISLIREIIKDMEDIRGDARFGCKTLPIIWGFRKTKIVIYAIIVISVPIILWILSFIHNDMLNYYFICLGLLMIYFVVKLYQADAKNKFHFLSGYCKAMMLTGILSMFLL